MYAFQAILGDIVLYEAHLNTMKDALKYMHKVEKDPTNEATSLRIITEDGEFCRECKVA